MKDAYIKDAYIISEITNLLCRCARARATARARARARARLISRSPISCMCLSASFRFGGLSSFGVLSLPRWLLLSPYCLTSLLYTHDVYP